MTNTLDQLEKPNKKAVATKQVIALAEKNGGTITPEVILDEARKKSSPLHCFFCWDNTAAAEEYRKIQAAALIRRIKVTIHTDHDTKLRVRAFVNVIEPTSDHNDTSDIDEQGINCRQRGIYVTMESACRFDDYRNQMIQQCKRDVESFRQKYSALNEAANIINAMGEFELSFAME